MPTLEFLVKVYLLNLVLLLLNNFCQFQLTKTMKEFKENEFFSMLSQLLHTHAQFPRPGFFFARSPDLCRKETAQPRVRASFPPFSISTDLSVAAMMLSAAARTTSVLMGLPACFRARIYFCVCVFVCV